MRMRFNQFLVGGLSVFLSMGVYADNASEQILLLKSQIRVEFQKLETQRQADLKDIQAKLQTMQADIQAIQDVVSTPSNDAPSTVTDGTTGNTSSTTTTAPVGIQ
ncbi:MAG: hypothetical protein QNK11_05805 [Legionella sp.]|nr:hypothetical protein [Legionella sp.]